MVNSPEIMETLQELKLAVGDLRTFLRDVDSSIKPLGPALEETIRDVQKLVQDVDQDIEKLASSADCAVAAARRAFEQREKTLSMEHGAPGKLATSARRAMDSIRKVADAALPTVVEAEKTLANMETLTAEDSPANYQISNALKELSVAARSIRVWAEYLERHPEALIRGKGGRR